MSDKIYFSGQDCDVEMGVEIPPRARVSAETDELVQLPVDGCIFVECTPDERTKLSNRVRSVKKRHGGDFTTRTYEDGVRIWRTE